MQLCEPWSPARLNVEARPSLEYRSGNYIKYRYHSFAGFNIGTGTSVDFMLSVKRLSENATLPTRAPSAVGLDLYSAQTVTIAAHDNALVQTDLSMQVPPSTYGRITNKRKLGLKNKLEVYAGIVDGTNTGNVGVVLFNHGDTSVDVIQGECIAQMILEQVVIAQVKEGDNVY